MVGLPEGRQAQAWIGATWGDHVLLEPTFAGARFAVCAPGIATIGGSSLVGRIAAAGVGKRLPWGGESPGVLLGDSLLF